MCRAALLGFIFSPIKFVNKFDQQKKNITTPPDFWRYADDSIFYWNWGTEQFRRFEKEAAKISPSSKRCKIFLFDKIRPAISR